MLRFVSILLALYGIYSLYLTVESQAYLYVVWQIVIFAAAVGLWLKKRWSLYLVYFLSAAFIVQWLWLLWRAIQNGLWPYEGVSQNLIALFPGILLMSLAVLLSFAAYRGFRAQS